MKLWSRNAWTAGVCSAVLFFACDLPVARADDATDLLAMITGEYDNKKLIAQELGDTREGLVKAKPRHLIVSPMALPNIPGETVYLEWRQNEKTGPLATQRIWAFSETPGGMEMRFYTLHEKASDTLLGLTKANAMAQALTLDDVFAYHETCTFHFRRSGERFIGELEDDTCVMLQRSQNLYMTVNALIEITPNMLREYTEFIYSRPDKPMHFEDRVYDKIN